MTHLAAELAIEPCGPKKFTVLSRGKKVRFSTTLRAFSGTFPRNVSTPTGSSPTTRFQSFNLTDVKRFETASVVDAMFDDAEYLKAMRTLDEKLAREIEKIGGKSRPIVRGPFFAPNVRLKIGRDARVVEREFDLVAGVAFVAAVELGPVWINDDRSFSVTLHASYVETRRPESYEVDADGDAVMDG